MGYSICGQGQQTEDPSMSCVISVQVCTCASKISTCFELQHIGGSRVIYENEHLHEP